MTQEEEGGAAVRLATVLWTIASLAAFAGNSLLCRLALLPREGGEAVIGPVSFTAIRLLAGAAALAPALLVGRGDDAPTKWSPWPAIAIGVYAIAFSCSYVTLPAGIGALVLFGVVQLVMIGVAVMRGERLGPLRTTGVLCAFAGVVTLVRPWESEGGAPDLLGALLMAVAGVGWAVYTLLGRGARRPVRANAVNFATCALPAGIALAVVALTSGETVRTEGVWIAVVSGAVTSGAGYAMWYTALRGHTRTSAAVVQLLVPVLAVIGGVWWLGESVDAWLVGSGVLVLGGVGTALVSGRR